MREVYRGEKWREGGRKERRGEGKVGGMVAWGKRKSTLVVGVRNCVHGMLVSEWLSF